jgi:DNA polymerase (family 10)
VPIQNAEVAERFERLADLLEIQGANPFRVRAYRNAAQTIRALARRLSEMVEQEEDLSKLFGIGKDLAAKIEEIVETGSLSLLEEVERETGPELADLLRIPGLGPKRARVLHEILGVGSLRELATAARSGAVAALPGFGPKTEQAILAALERAQETEQRVAWVLAEPIAASLVDYLKRIPGVRDVEVAGSFRRRRESVGDLDVLVTCQRGAPISERFVAYEDVAKVVACGTTRSTVLLRSGLQVDLRVVPRVSYGAALHYFTGSKAHNIAIRKLGMGRKLKINEYGVFRGKKRRAGRTEVEVYRQVGLPFIPPELREDRGEIQAARRGRLPRLVSLDQIRGDLHTHTRASDGRSTLREMAAAAQRRGYEYLAVSEHTRALRVARGLDPARMRRHLRRIDRLNRELDGVVLLKSAEVDILEDGSLDLPDDLLAELDLTVCAIHSHFQLSGRKQTDRILRAMDNPHFHILAHPTGRRIGSRDPYPLDLERVIAGAAERGCCLELNAQPERLDLTDVYCRAAKERGVKLVISTDAHAADQLDFMRFGVDQARRGWLEAEDVLNTRSRSRLLELVRRS